MKILFRSLYRFGDYILLLKKIFTTPDRWSEFLRRFKDEAYMLVIGSIAIVVTISLFIGAVITIQTQLNVSSPLLPAYTVGLVTRDTLLLEFSSSIMCLLLAGKIGSNIASEIGTMRVTEQIDALDIMGVNSANYLILPKIAAMVVFYSGFGRFQHVLGALRRIYRLDIYRHHSGITVHLRAAILFHRILCLVHHYQIILLRFRHQQRSLLLRIPGKRRCTRSGQSQYRLGRSEQRHDTPARRDTY